MKKNCVIQILSTKKIKDVIYNILYLSKKIKIKTIKQLKNTEKINIKINKLFESD